MAGVIPPGFLVPRCGPVALQLIPTGCREPWQCRRWAAGGRDLHGPFLTVPPVLADYSQDEKALLGACDCSQSE